MSSAKHEEDIESLIREAERIIEENRSHLLHKKRSTNNSSINITDLENLNMAEILSSSLNSATNDTSENSRLSDPIASTSSSPNNTIENINQNESVNTRLLETQEDDIIYVDSTPINPNSRPIVDYVDLCFPDNTLTTNTKKRHTIENNDVIYIVDSPPTTKRSKKSTLESSQSENENYIEDRTIAKCPICLESSINRKPISTICGHVFCNDCITKSMQSKHICPVCKKKLTKKGIHPIFF